MVSAMLTRPDFGASVCCEVDDHTTSQPLENFETIISSRITSHNEVNLDCSRGATAKLPPEKRKIIHLLESVLTNLL
jgi:hypothetical protein